MVNAKDSDDIRLKDLGDEGLAQVINKHRERLERIVDLRLDPRLSGRVDAADILQEAFLEAQKKLRRYLNAPAAPAFVWLRGIVLDTLIHAHRRHFSQMRNVRLEVPIGAELPAQVHQSALTRNLVAKLTSPSQVAIRAEVASAIAEALESMDEIDREALILRHFEQLSNDETAEVMGVKKAAASRRYARALQRFQQRFDESLDSN